MQLQISHTSEYRYDHPVDYALQKVRLRPQPSVIQDVGQWSIDVTGGKVETSYIDHYGNHVDLISITPGSDVVAITAHGTISTQDVAGVLGQVYGRAPLWHFKQSTAATDIGAGLKSITQAYADADTPLNGLHALSAAILAATPYEIGKTDATTTAEEALQIGAGVCQDHAQIFIAACRHVGLPARYVSGS